MVKTVKDGGYLRFRDNKQMVRRTDLLLKKRACARVSQVW